jgi:DNA polymerase-3 subunit beta
VIPKDTDKLARLSRVELHGAILRAALLTSDEARAVRMSFSRERLVITAQSPEQGEARVEMPMEYEGEPVEIGFNAAFVNDALKVIPFDTVCVELKESFRPGVVRGEDRNEFLYVVMPISL